MIRLALVLCLFVATAGRAQDPTGPILRVDFPETEAVPGQPLSLRLTVLVPSFMPKPPVWPTLEAPNLLVRLPEGSTNPTSERIEGETWAGITRHYRISPMVPGQFSIPPQDVIVTYADPDSSAPIEATLTTGPLAFTGTVPEGAEGLDPFIAADSLKLEQSIEGDPAAMTPGASVKRSVTASVSGVSPIFLPNLLPAAELSGVAAYPDEPAVEEHDNRGEVSGTRVETVTYLAQGGGGGAVPRIDLKWYNLGSKQVETASVDGFAIEVDGPPVSNAEPRDWRMLALISAGGLALLAIGFVAIRRLAHRLSAWLRHRKEIYLASEGHAFRVLTGIVDERDFPKLYPALDSWAAIAEGPDPRDRTELRKALARLGAGRYGSAPSDTEAAWKAVEKAIRQARTSRVVGSEFYRRNLPPLNPGRSVDLPGVDRAG